MITKMDEKENKRINLRVSENVYNQLKKIKSQNKTDSLNKTVGLILKQYFIKEGMFDDPVNNVFLREFKEQTAKTMAELVEENRKNTKIIVKSLNELSELMREQTVSNKEKNVEIDLLIDEIKAL